jgi:CBS domain containing-hemolysin-like protein
MMFILFLLIIFFLAVVGFFSRVEFAASTAAISRLDELLKTKEDPAGDRVRFWLSQPEEREQIVAVAQVGLAVSSLALGAISKDFFESLTGIIFIETYSGWLAFLDTLIPVVPWILSISLVAACYIVFSVQIPRARVLQSPEAFLLKSASTITFYSRLLGQFTQRVQRVALWFQRELGLNPEQEYVYHYSAADIREIVEGAEAGGVIEEPEKEMLSAVIDFGDLVVRQIVTPRTEVVSVNVETSGAEVIHLCLEHGITKIPVYEVDLDHIVGIVHLRDLVKRLMDNGIEKFTAGDVQRPAMFVPETISVSSLLQQFRISRKHIAIVLDEFGGTSGLVTLEDLLEEIVGDVKDPFETGVEAIKLSPDGSAVIDGMMLLEDFNAYFGLELQQNNYDTVAGFVLEKLDRIPSVGDLVVDSEQAIMLRVEKMDHLRIESVYFRRL